MQMFSLSRIANLPWNPITSAAMAFGGLRCGFLALGNFRSDSAWDGRKAEEQLAKAVILTSGGAALWLTRRPLPVMGVVVPGLLAANLFLPRDLTIRFDNVPKQKTQPKPKPFHQESARHGLQRYEPMALGNLVGYPAWQQADAMRTFANGLYDGGPKPYRELRTAALEMAGYAEEAKQQLERISDEIGRRLRNLREIVQPLAEESRKAGRDMSRAELIHFHLYSAKDGKLHFDWIADPTRLAKPERLSWYTQLLGANGVGLDEFACEDPALRWSGDDGIKRLLDSAAEWRLTLEKKFPQHNLPELVKSSLDSLQ